MKWVVSTLLIVILSFNSLAQEALEPDFENFGTEENYPTKQEHIENGKYGNPAEQQDQDLVMPDDGNTTEEIPVRIQFPTSKKYNKVMVIPYNPNMYFSDADDAIAKASNKTPEEVRRMFRHGIAYDVSVRILPKYPIKNMLYDTSQIAQRDLYLIYKNISYHKAKSPSYRKEEENKPNDITSGENPVVKSASLKEYIAVEAPKQMLQYLHEKYGTDLFVFINQFDLITNYKYCTDRTINNFTRDVIVHFSIYDKEGNYLYGDAVKVTFDKNTNHIDEIMLHNFPVIADYIAQHIPGKASPDNEASPEEKPTIKEKKSSSP